MGITTPCISSSPRFLSPTKMHIEMAPLQSTMNIHHLTKIPTNFDRKRRWKDICFNRSVAQMVHLLQYFLLFATFALVRRGEVVFGERTRQYGLGLLLHCLLRMVRPLFPLLRVLRRLQCVLLIVIVQGFRVSHELVCVFQGLYINTYHQGRYR